MRARPSKMDSRLRGNDIEGYAAAGPYGKRADTGVRPYTNAPAGLGRKGSVKLLIVQ
jgi:hypothetical protein